MRKLLILLLIVGIGRINGICENYELTSPDGRISVTINVGEDVRYSVMHDSTVIINESAISMELEDGTILGVNGLVDKVKNKTVNEDIRAYFYKKTTVKKSYNELVINFKENFFRLTFRVF